MNWLRKSDEDYTFADDIKILAKEALKLGFDGYGIRHLWDAEFIEELATEVDRLTKGEKL